MTIRFTKEFLKCAKMLRPAERGKLHNRLQLFIQDQMHSSLKNHALKGKWSTYRSINITGDIRALYFVDGEYIVFDYLGTHSQLYG